MHLARLIPPPRTQLPECDTAAERDRLTVDLPPGLFAELAHSNSPPRVLDAAGSWCWLLLPIIRQQRPVAIASGLIATEDQDMLRRLAREFQQREALEDHRNQIDAVEQPRGVNNVGLAELTFLRKLTENLSLSDSSLETTEIADQILPELREHIHADAVVLVSAGRDKEACLVGRPLLWVGKNVIDDQSCIRLVERYRDLALRQKVVRSKDCDSAELGGVSGMHSFLLAPLVRSQVVLGWLVAMNHTPSHNDRSTGSSATDSPSIFEINEASLLRCTASVLATHANNIDLLRDKDQLLFDMVRALVNTVEAKDRYTSGHSERVALYAHQLASAMGLKPRMCTRIYLSGLLHDVGKIAVRDTLLSKTGRLSEDEYDEIQRHPDVGWGILFGLEALDDVLTGVLHHHERWDGQGYPDGLAGEHIPLDARLLAVADAFDAMTSDRPYRQALSVEEAEAILRKGAGSQWDPEVVACFLEVLPQIRQIRDTYEPRPPTSRGGYRMLREIDLDQLGLSAAPESPPA